MFGEKKPGDCLRGDPGGQKEKGRFARFMRGVFREGQAKKGEFTALSKGRVSDRKGDATAQRIVVIRKALSHLGARYSLVRNDQQESP